jgi:hypothetical protein
MDDWVIVDTCIWASFFAKPASAEKHAVDVLLDHDRVAILGVILGEVLLGVRRTDHADWVASRLRQSHYVEALWDDWRLAAQLGRDLAALGHKLPLTDLIVAAVAKRLGLNVYTVDPHFDLISNLKRHWPEWCPGYPAAGPPNYAGPTICPSRGFGAQLRYGPGAPRCGEGTR